METRIVIGVTRYTPWRVRLRIISGLGLPYGVALWKFVVETIGSWLSRYLSRPHPKFLTGIARRIEETLGSDGYLLLFFDAGGQGGMWGMTRIIAYRQKLIPLGKDLAEILAGLGGVWYEKNDCTRFDKVYACGCSESHPIILNPSSPEDKAEPCGACGHFHKIDYGIKEAKVCAVHAALQSRFPGIRIRLARGEEALLSPKDAASYLATLADKKEGVLDEEGQKELCGIAAQEDMYAYMVLKDCKSMLVPGARKILLRSHDLRFSHAVTDLLVMNEEEEPFLEPAEVRYLHLLKRTQERMYESAHTAGICLRIVAIAIFLCAAALVVHYYVIDWVTVGAVAAVGIMVCMLRFLLKKISSLHRIWGRFYK